MSSFLPSTWCYNSHNILLTIWHSSKVETFEGGMIVYAPMGGECDRQSLWNYLVIQLTYITVCQKLKILYHAKMFESMVVLQYLTGFVFTKKTVTTV